MALVREEALKKITDGLSWLAMECKLRGLLHLFDSNTISHELFCRLLNEVYDLALVQTDRIKANFPAIDLGDEVNKRCFQITTEKDGAKVQKTLDVFVQHRLTTQYGKLQILIVGDKQGSYKSVEVPAGFPFDPETDILELRDFLKHLDTLPTDKLVRVAGIIAEEIKLTPTPRPELPRVVRVQLLPANPADVTQLDLTRYIRNIKGRLRKSDARQAIDLVSSWTDSFDGLQQYLFNIQPRVLHIRGGLRGGDPFTLRPRDGDPVPVPDTVVRDLFSWLKSEVRLVILDRAMSESQAMAVREESLCTVSISPGASAEAALSYLTTFYRDIGYGESVRAAHERAVTALRLDGHALDTVSLVPRPDCDPSTLRLVAPPPPEGGADAKVRFVQLEMATDQCLWEEMRRFRSPEAPIFHPLTGRPWFGQVYEVPPKDQYPFGAHQLANYHWPEAQRDSESRVADPILEFTVVNQGTSPAVISRIGFRVANAWNAAKAAPLAFKMVSYDAYELPVSDFVIGEDQTLRLPDPICLQPHGSYRFRLRLQNYATGAKVNETVIRLLVIADTDTYLSDEIYLGIMWTGDSFTSRTNATEQISNEAKPAEPNAAPDSPSKPGPQVS